MRLPFSPFHHCASNSSSPFPTNLLLLQYPSSSSSSPRRRPTWPRMEFSSNSSSSTCVHRHRSKDKVVVILGATGSGKSHLSLDIATRFPSEIINSDKMQVYKGLEITTNKIPIHQRLGVPHHLLGDIDPSNGEFTPSDYRSLGGSIVSDIALKKKLPLVVGGSNTFIHALVVDRFDPESDVFDECLINKSFSSSTLSELRYKCCFLWVDVSFPVLSDYLSKRVDEMLESGMLYELAEFYDPEADDLEMDSEYRSGLRKAIGVPEFDRYFRKYPPPVMGAGGGGEEEGEDDHLRRRAYEEAVRAIKDNTCRLAKRQIRKILRLKSGGWDLRRIDATAAFREVMTSESSGGKRWAEIWERQVVEPSVKIVKRFLKE